MDIQPCGYLPFKVAFEPGDRLILCPAYIFPIEVLERGLMTRIFLSGKPISGATIRRVWKGT